MGAAREAPGCRFVVLEGTAPANEWGAEADYTTTTLKFENVKGATFATI